MNIDLVTNNINNIIKIGLTKDESIEKIVVDLEIRRINISKLLTKENSDLTYLSKLSLKDINLEEIDISNRGLYALYFIFVSRQKINELFWIKGNKNRFPNKNLIELHNLIQFKNKLRDKSYKIPS